ncbi:MAG: nucleotidyl transferase AbiEii/AbiGii toxin family protein [Candidatus Pacebacteria bacterium]|nr:nucleotidyl transferase AbiEii/AbiGii toxin family protein [Candidatus Paceibacterota bacterium]
MLKILKDIYSDVEISSLLGLKGGTAAYFFYDLPRFSVDLDFDLLDASQDNKELVFSKIENTLKDYGTIKEKCIKRWTIFSLLSYGDDDHNVKIEISTRSNNNQYELKNHLGIAMFVAKKETLFANKLVALTGRKNMAMRDVFDIYFFAKNSWDIDEEIIKFWTKENTKKHLIKCVKKIKEINERAILQGLGEKIKHG